MLQARGQVARWLVFSLWVAVNGVGVTHASFQHPGLLHSRADLEFIREKVSVGEQPWHAAWDRLRSRGTSSLESHHKPKAVEESRSATTAGKTMAEAASRFTGQAKPRSKTIE